MVKVTLKDGTVKEYASGITAAAVAKDLGMGLYKACLLYTSDTMIIILEIERTFLCAVLINGTMYYLTLMER